MRDDSIDLLAIENGTITAPAGCGKTHLIIEAIKRHPEAKPILVLTHTNAGVAALRMRLDRQGIASRACRISTIDGWAMRLISTFPQRSGHVPAVLSLTNPRSDYPDIRDAACRLLASGHISDILNASYSRLIVDEYQDCSTRQHALIAWASRILPTVVLGDPLQAIFDFGSDRLVDWNAEVLACFPLAGHLNTPWRWINAQAEPLGQWLLDVRANLLDGLPINLRCAPAAVDWVHLDGTDDYKRCLKAGRVNPPGNVGSVLILDKSAKPSSQQKFASRTPGAVVVEAVDLNDLVSFGTSFHPTNSNAFEVILDFAKRVMRNVRAANIQERVNTLQKGTAKKPATEVEKAALGFLLTPTFGSAAALLTEINKQPDVSVHRPAILKSCIRALNSCAVNGGSFGEATIKMREQNRMVGRPLPKRAVGSTLLMKGLEAEVAVILNASELNSRHLYVAMTRGSKALKVCARSAILAPQR